MILYLIIEVQCEVTEIKITEIAESKDPKIRYKPEHIS